MAINGSGLLSKNEGKRLNRAADFFGDPVKRFNDWLVLEGNSCADLYSCGRIALILHGKLSELPKVNSAASAGSLVNEEGATPDQIVFIVFKANIIEPHHLQHWNEKLVFVPDVQIVQGPQGKIPSLMGLYGLNNEIVDPSCDSLLFEGSLHRSYKLFPRSSYWESCVIRGGAPTGDNRFVPKQIKRTSEIVQNIPNNKGAVLKPKFRFINLEPQVIAASLYLHAEGVEVVSGDSFQKALQVLDVFVGPFELES